MSRAFFATELDTAASWWRIYRKDGVTLGFTTHDRDLRFDGILHRAAPGMLPSAIRRTMSLADDEAEVEGALGHDTIRAEDIAGGRFDGARIESGIVDWQTLEKASLYIGAIDTIGREGGGFQARLQSAKAELEIDPVPRTSPSCRAEFCGPGCGLSPARFTSRTTVLSVDYDENKVELANVNGTLFVQGGLRFLAGPQAGVAMRIVSVEGGWFELDLPLAPQLQAGTAVTLREGCDRTIATCASRFGNAINFQGEPHLPGTDFLLQYPQPR